MRLNLFRRLGVCAAALIVASAMLIAPAYAQKKLVVGWNMPHINDALKAEMFAKFEAEHNVVLEEAPRDRAQVITYFVGGQQLDVVQVNAGQYVVEFVQKGMLIPLDDYFERSPEVVGDWIPTIMDALRVDGKAYWVPRGEIDALSLLWVNGSVLEEAGLSLPGINWTREEFEAMAQAVRSDRNGDGQADRWLTSYRTWLGYVPYYLNGGGLYEDPSNPRRSALGDPASLDALEWIQMTVERDLVPATVSPDALGALAAGTVAMATEGARKAVPAMQNGNVAHQGVTLVPAGPAGQIATGELQGFGISSISADPDLAWEWLKFISREEYWRHWLTARFTPTLSRKLTPEFIALDPGISQFGEAFLAFFQQPFILYRSIVPNTDQLIHDQLFNSILGLRRSAKQAVEELGPRIQTVYDEFYGG